MNTKISPQTDFLANSCKVQGASTGAQNLAAHNALVGLLARKIILTLYPERREWARAALMAGCAHDLGKVDPKFQEFARAGQLTAAAEDGAHIDETAKNGKKFSFTKYPRHNEVSWALMRLCFDSADGVRSLGNADLWRAGCYAVYWHHAKVLREKGVHREFGTLSDILGKLDKSLPDTLTGVKALWSDILAQGDLASDLPGMRDVDLDLTDIGSIPVPGFKEGYAKESNVLGDKRKITVLIEAMRSAVRSAVISADRMVSAMSREELAQWLDAWRASDRSPTSEALPELPSLPSDESTALMAQIAQMRASYDSRGDHLRNEQQAAAAAALARQCVSVLRGPAGCGKTKIALEYIERVRPGQTFLVVPRTVIGQSLFEDLTRGLSSGGYGIDVDVELCTGDLKLLHSQTLGRQETPADRLLGATLVITTVDQILSIVLSHQRVDALTRVMRATMIFDEFHELFEIPGIALMFLELMQLRQEAAVAATRTLLVSATPNAYFLSKLGIDARQVVPVETFNDKPFELRFGEFDESLPESHPFNDGLAAGVIAVSNTATQAQICAIAHRLKGQQTLCFHSKLTPADRRDAQKRIFESFGKGKGSDRHVLFAGPIVQASFDITTRHMLTEGCHAENWLQRLGRVNRFGDFERGMLTTYVLAPTVKHTVLSATHQRKRTKAWLSALRAQCDSRATPMWTLEQLYEFYEQFHGTPAAQDAYAEDFDGILKESARKFDVDNEGASIFDPMQLPPALRQKHKERILAASSLRGASSYVLPWAIEIDGSGTIKNRGWLYGDDHGAEHLLTDELRGIRHLNQDDSGKFLAYMRSKALEVHAYTRDLPSQLREKFGSKKGPKGRGGVPSMRSWAQLARSRRVPVVVSMPTEGRPALPFEFRYVYVGGMAVGLIKQEKLECGIDLKSMAI